MDFTIPEELAQVRQAFATFLQREVAPLDETHRGALGRGEWTAQMAADGAALRRRSCAHGFYAAHLPEAVGGWGLPALGMTLLVEDAARSGLAFAAFALGPPNPSAPTAMLLGLPEHLQATYLEPLMSGEATMCFALTEPEAGSDAQSIRTTARREGDEWVIDGTKHYITNGDAADFAVVFAVTDAGRRAHGGITAFVVPAERYEVGAIQHTMADSHPAELIFDGARVPADHVIGEVGAGFREAMAFLDSGRAYIGAQCLGLAQWCLDQAVAHAQQRTAFGQPIGAFQGVSFPLAQSRAEIEAMRWLTYHLAWQIDRGDHPAADSSIVKYYNTERAYQIADRCLQAFGGQGLLTDGPVEAALRHLRMLRVVEGPSEIQLLLIARSLGL